MANLVVSATSEWNGKGLAKGKKDIGGFEKSIEGLAKKFAGLFAAQKIIAFGKASAEAFMEDQKSAALLANTLKNLSLEFAAPQMETFIANLSKTAAVADDELRPAMQKLLTQTGNYFKSQELLTQAIEISRGSGVDLTTVTQDLANAYVGNTKGLKKYNLGLTQAQLKTMSFTQVQKKLADQFKGSNAAYLKTYAGQMQILTVASGEAKETIGKGLIESLALLSGDGSVQSLADAMQSFADFTSNSIYAVASLATELKNLGAAAPSWLQKLMALSTNVGPLGTIKNGIKGLQTIANYGERQRNKTLQNPSVQMFMADEANNRLNNEQFKKQQKVAADQLKATKALTAEQKKQAALKKDSAVFDEQRINLIAALKGQLSEDDRKRAELQLALLDGNLTEADKLTKQILLSQDATGKLYAYFQQTPDAKNPFGYLDQWIKDFQTKLDALKFPDPPSPLGPVSQSERARLLAPIGNGASTIGDYLDGVGLIPDTTGMGAGSGGGVNNSSLSLTVTGEGPITNAIAAGIQNSSLSTGNVSFINRRTGGFD